jgi:hypothetical protein
MNKSIAFGPKLLRYEREYFGSIMNFVSKTNIFDFLEDVSRRSWKNVGLTLLLHTILSLMALWNVSNTVRRMPCVPGPGGRTYFHNFLASCWGSSQLGEKTQIFFLQKPCLGLSWFVRSVSQFARAAIAVVFGRLPGCAGGPPSSSDVSSFHSGPDNSACRLVVSFCFGSPRRCPAATLTAVWWSIFGLEKVTSFYRSGRSRISSPLIAWSPATRFGENHIKSPSEGTRKTKEWAMYKNLSQQTLPARGLRVGNTERSMLDPEKTQWRIPF